jgi:hypothetical protein
MPKKPGIPLYSKHCSQSGRQVRRGVNSSMNWNAVTSPWNLRIKTELTITLETRLTGKLELFECKSGDHRLVRKIGFIPVLRVCLRTRCCLSRTRRVRMGWKRPYEPFLFFYEKAIDLSDESQQLYRVLLGRGLFRQLHPAVSVFASHGLGLIIAELRGLPRATKVSLCGD